MTSATRTWILGLGAALLIVLLLAPFASEDPDTLEHTTRSLGANLPGNAVVPAPMPDYSVPGFPSKRWSTVVAGAVGMFAVVLLLRLVVRPRPRENPPSNP